MDTSRRIETPGSEKKLFVIYGKSSSQVLMFSQVPHAPWAPRARCGSLHGQRGRIAGEEHGRWGFIASRSKLDLYWGKTLSHPSRLHIANTWRNRAAQNSGSEVVGASHSWGIGRTTFPPPMAPDDSRYTGLLALSCRDSVCTCVLPLLMPVLCCLV